MRGEPAGVVPVVTEDPHGMSALPSGYEFFEGLRKEKAGAWVNQVSIKRLTLSSGL